MKTNPSPEPTAPHDDGLDWIRAIRREITASSTTTKPASVTTSASVKNSSATASSARQRRVVPVSSS